MATRATRKKHYTHSGRGQSGRHPIRIVPLHSAARLAPATTPHLSYRNGPLLTNAEVYCIYWGSAWQSAANAKLSQQMDSFFDFILTSPLLDQLGEYSVPGKTIGHGSRTGSRTVTSSEPGASIEDSAIQDFVRGNLASGNFPASDANSLYFVFLPPGTQVTQQGAASCQDFCGYHDVTTEGVFYAVMPYAGCTGCLGGLSAVDALTSTSSHELCEAITDPMPGQGWYDDANGEIGDICAWRTKKIGDFTVQLEWSNAAGACV